MKRLIYLTVLGAALLAVSCEKEKDDVPQGLWNTVERISGYYTLDSLEWEGPEVDLNGDGTADGFSLENFKRIGWTGFSSLSHRLSYVIPVSGSGNESRIVLCCFVGYAESYYNNEWRGGIECRSINAYYKISDDGEFTVTDINEYDVNDSHNQRCLKNGSVTFDKNWNLVFSYDTKFINRQTFEMISGRLTIHYHNNLHS